MANETENREDGQQQQATGDQTTDGHDAGAEAGKKVTLSLDELDQIISKRANQIVANHMKRIAPQPKVETKEHQDENQTLRARVKSLEDAEKQKVQQLHQAQRENSLRAALQSSGAANIEGAIAILERKGKIYQDERGGVMFRRGMEKNEVGEFPDDVPLEDGIRSWLASEEGAWYAAPKDAQGSGARQRQGSQGKGSSKGSKEERDNRLFALFGGGKR